MDTKTNRTALKVDASVFHKQDGDQVKKGEVLGNYAGQAVKAPFDGVVEGVSFDSDNHALVVVLQES